MWPFCSLRGRQTQTPAAECLDLAALGGRGHPEAQGSPGSLWELHPDPTSALHQSPGHQVTSMLTSKAPRAAPPPIQLAAFSKREAEPRWGGFSKAPSSPLPHTPRQGGVGLDPGQLLCSWQHPPGCPNTVPPPPAVDRAVLGGPGAPVWSPVEAGIRESCPDILLLLGPCAQAMQRAGRPALLPTQALQHPCSCLPMQGP